MNQLENAFFSRLRKKGAVMEKIKKAIWFTLGIILLGVAYLGVILPGLPWSTPALGAAFCFAKSSKKFHDFILNHPKFGPFIKNWSKHRVYPTYAKFFMVTVMLSSLGITYYTTGNEKAVFWMFMLFSAIVVWASRYPGSQAEAERRIKAGEKIGWLK